MTLALVIFLIMYGFLLAVDETRRWIVALATALVFIVLGILPLESIVGAINWNVLMMLAGTMATVELFIESKMPSRMAELLLKLTPDIRWAIVALSLFSGLISAFVDNVATVLMLAPIGLEVSDKLKINPVPVIISIAVSSNLQGAATLVGDTTSILLGSYANMSFNDFFWFHGKPGIFFAVELGALMTIPILLWIFKDEKRKVETEGATVVKDYVPGILLAGTILSLIIASGFENKPELTNGLLCIGFAVIATVYEIIRQKDQSVAKTVVSSIDYRTLLLLAGLFMVIEGITQAGVIDAAADLFVKLSNGSIVLTYVLVVAASVALSAFIDNIPYVATMLPVVTGISAILGIEPYLLDFGLLIGATLGGNITPVGASANIAGTGILNQHGYKVAPKDFFRIGIPFTLAAALSGSLFVYLVWH